MEVSKVFGSHPPTVKFGWRLNARIWPGSGRRTMILNWKQVTLCAFALAFGSSPLHAQRGSGTIAGGGGGIRSGSGGPSASSGGVPIFESQPATQPNLMQPGMISEATLPRVQIVEDETCFPWAISSIRGATVSVMRLEVPDKARSEYDKACSDFRKKKFAEAEEHIRGAIETYSNYVAAWVMMGQVLEAEQQVDKAHDACSHASTADPTYLPPYICLAELDAKSGHWDELLNVTNMALGLNPVGDVYAYFYRSQAFFNMNKLQEAEKSALTAEGMDAEHHQPSVHYLLAQIDEAKGDVASAIAEVKQFLKLNQDKLRTDEAKRYLAKLEAPQSETASK
jgi:tetratricopeptide (TPR) repeat protein